MTSPTETAWIQTAFRPSGPGEKPRAKPFAQVDPVLLQDLHPERIDRQIEGEGDGQDATNRSGTRPLEYTRFPGSAQGAPRRPRSTLRGLPRGGDFC